MTKIKVGCLLFFLIFAVFCTLPAQAPTQADIEAAIVNGVKWLANQQEADGSWSVNGWTEAITGLAVLKLEERAYELDYDSPFDPDYEYHENVTLGLNYLFSHLLTVNITLQDHTSGHGTGTVDDPDFNGNGLGVYVAYPCVYQTGIVLAAISASRTPMELAVDGPVNGWTYQQVAQDMVDWLAWAQSDKDYPQYGMGEGGWEYVALNNASSGGVDNSNSGYAVLGLEYAIRFGCTLHDWVKIELNVFIDDIQEDDGGSAYRRLGDEQENILKTGNLIFEMKLFGDTTTTPRVVNALNYLKAHWNDASGSVTPPGWDGNPAEYQTMFCAMKGLHYMGIDTFGGIDWYADFSDRIVAQQCEVSGPDYGSWQDTSGIGYYPILITEWALLTLEKVPPPPPMHLDAEPPILINLTDPVGTAWHELYPSYCNWHYLAGWFDSNNNSTLDRGDHIILDNETGYSGWYHVEDVTVTLNLTKKPYLNETMYVEFSGSIQEFPFSAPKNTTWHEVYPEYGNWFNLTSWNDTNPTLNLTSSDQIEMTPIPSGINATEWHVDAVKTDLLVTFEKHPDFGDAPDERESGAWPFGYPSKQFSKLGSYGAVPPNTTSYWSFDEGSGTTALDIRDNNHGTLTGGPSWILGVAYTALNFDGNDDHVSVPDHNSLDFEAGADFSVQAWINASVVSSTRTIIDKRTGGYPELGYAVYIWNGRLGLRLADNSGSTNYNVPADMSIAADNQWHFVSVSVDRDKSATFCVDCSETSIPIAHPGSLANSAPLWIGGHQLGSYYYFSGGIDEVAIYNRSLTSREVRQLCHRQVRDGASHIDWNYEWLGENVNGELDSKQVDKDEFDDGVKIAFYNIPPKNSPDGGTGWFLKLTITITTSNEPGRYDINDPDKKMYLNAWIDWTQDGDWADSREKIIGTGGFYYPTQAFAGPQTMSYSIPFKGAYVAPSDVPRTGNWLRVRLDYGEDVGANPQSWTDPSLDQYKGQAMFGEVEDYIVPDAVGGIRVPIDKLGLLAPYIGSISLITLIGASVVCFRRRRKTQQ